MEINILLAKLILIILLSFLIGLEREYRHQPAGLRTHILIGLGSTLLMILSIEVAKMSGSAVADPGRIAAQVVTGIGFIGAGAIMKIGLNTKGLTTAANIWVTSAIGLIVGAGFYEIAVIATVLILFNLIAINKIKTVLIKKSRYCNVSITFEKKKGSDKKIMSKIQKLDFDIIGKEIKETKSHVNMKLVIKVQKETDIYHIHEDLNKIPNLSKTYISENMR